MSVTQHTLTQDIDHHLQEAENIYLTDYGRLNTLAEEIIPLAWQANTPAHVAIALAYQSWAQLFLGDIPKSLRLALDALILARENLSLRGEYLALRSLAGAFERSSLSDDAMRLYELQRQVVTRLDDPSLHAAVLNNIGSAEMMRNPLKAVRMFQSALSILPSMPETFVRRVLFTWNLALALAMGGRLAEALMRIEEAIQMADHTGSKLWQTRVRTTNAYILALNGAPKEAHAQLDAVRDDIFRQNLPDLSAEFHLQTGMILLEQNRTLEAIGALEDAYQVMVDNGILRLQTEVLRQLAACYEKLNDMAGVVTTYKRMTDGIFAQQQHTSDLRFSVMKTAFDVDRAAMEARTRTVQLQTSALQRLSHEFRTPLAVIKSSAALISHYGDRISPESTRARLAEITHQVHWMSVLIDDINALLQPSTTEMPLAAFTIDQLIRTAVKDTGEYRLDVTRIIVNSGDWGSVLVSGAYEALRRSLVQLLTNALKFSTRAVDVTAMIEQSNLVISVRDRASRRTNAVSSRDPCIAPPTSAKSAAQASASRWSISSPAPPEPRLSYIAS